MWDFVFKSANFLAMLAWFVLILLPRKPITLSAVMYLGVALLCLVYSVSMISIIGGFVDPVGPDDAQGGFTSIEGVRALFASDGGLTVGWVHYLAFDLFVGLWIARDADAKYFSRVLQAPILLLTFMLGPIGLLLWLIIREGRARTFGWKRNRINV
ncbi:ABA4-like family protein [Pontixanthobacter sp. CEM42]|uniref:ABA4-like family protein n=1 Tax=Pontixanthobacter sp. CEM42 TaxID=2792077 RepID=UPI001ADFCD3C|nr:ABA4-like family protein [Pontixanthobacter sp. CEM42]